MLRFLSKLFGGGEAAKETVDLVSTAAKGIGTWIDEQQLTDEERVKYLAKAAEYQLQVMDRIAEENGPRAVTRRYLAWGIVGSILFAFFVLVVGFLLGWVEREDAEFVVGLVQALWLGPAFTAVVTAYFGVSWLRSLRKGK